MTNGKGGSYVVDPKTGEPVLVERTGPSEDEQARELANKSARDKETAAIATREADEKKAAGIAAKESAKKLSDALKAAQVSDPAPVVETKASQPSNSERQAT